jgi:hypothetical protein
MIRQIIFLALLFICTMWQPCLATTPPTISPGTGVYPNASNPGGRVTMSAGTGATIYYTTNGTTPTTSSTVYTAAFTISSSTVVNAIAVVSGVSSSVTTSYIALDTNALAVARTNLLFWYRSDFGVLTSSSQVSQWTDLSGNGDNATQITSADQPSLVNNGINGLPVLSFNGTSDFLTLPSVTFTSSGATFFIVAKPTALVASAQLLDFSGATVPDNLVGISESSSLKAPQFSIFNSAGTSSTTVIGSSALTLNQFQVLEAVQGDINTTTATVFVNGIQAAQNTSMNTVPAVALSKNFIGQYSGAGEYFQGQIAEILAFTGPLTLSQRVAVEAYLSQKYQIPSQVPTAPIISVATATLSGPTQVALSAQPNSIIYFTLDGTAPTTSSLTYNGPINVYYTLTLKAMAVNNAFQSTVSSATYTLNAAQWPAPSAGGPGLQINLTLPSSAIPQ